MVIEEHDEEQSHNASNSKGVCEERPAAYFSPLFFFGFCTFNGEVMGDRGEEGENKGDENKDVSPFSQLQVFTNIAGFHI